MILSEQSEQAGDLGHSGDGDPAAVLKTRYAPVEGCGVVPSLAVQLAYTPPISGNKVIIFNGLPGSSRRICVMVKELLPDIRQQRTYRAFLVHSQHSGDACGCVLGSNSRA